MSLAFTLLLALAAPELGPAPAPDISPCAIRCRYECVCFRTNGYRCLRTYTQPCKGRACWECQGAVTHKARLSCSLGDPIKSCFCKFKKL